MEQNLTINSSELFSEKIPQWVTEQAPPPRVNAPEKDFSDGVVFLLVDRQIDYNTFEFFYHVAMQITSPVGLQNNSTINIEFSPSYEEIRIHRAGIIRNGTFINMASPDHLKIVEMSREEDRFVYSGVKKLDIHFEDARVGDIIEYSYTNAGWNPIFNEHVFTQFPLGYSFPIGVIFHKLIIPKRCRLNFKTFGVSAAFTQRTSGEDVIHELRLVDVPRIAVEDLLPIWHEPLPFYCVSDFTSWGELGRWAVGLFRISEVPDENLGTIVDGIVGNNPETGGQIRAALTFVQNEIHYLADLSGIYGFTPHSPELVLKQRFGDCKDKSLLLCAILRRLGVSAHPALVSTYLRGTVADRPPHPNAFNHCVVRVRHENDEYWYDPTSFAQGGSYDNIYFPDFRMALLLDEEKPDLVTIPFRRLSRMRIDERFELGMVNEPGRLNVRTEYEGGQADSQRTTFQRESHADIEKRYQGFYNNIYGEINSGPCIGIEDDPETNTFVISESYEFKNPWKPMPSDDTMAVFSIYFHGIKNCLPVPAVKERAMPIGLSDDIDIEHSIHIDGKEKLNNQNVKKISSDFGIDHRMDLSISNNSTEAVTTLTTSVDHIPADRTKSYLELADTIYNEIDYELKLPVVKAAKSKFAMTPGMAFGLFLLISLLIKACGSILGTH